MLHQDLRQPLPPSVPQAFQLITGTPPYIPPGAGGQSNKPQKGPCCVEIRGGGPGLCNTGLPPWFYCQQQQQQWRIKATNLMQTDRGSLCSQPCMNRGCWVFTVGCWSVFPTDTPFPAFFVSLWWRPAGGIEDYCQAAAAVLDRGGCFVACMGLQGQPFKGRRAQLAAAAAGLVITRQVTVVTREGKPPLFGVYVMQHAGDVLRQQQDDGEQGSAAAAGADGGSSGSSRSGSSSESSLAVQVAAGQLLGSEETFIVRHADGRHTAAWHAAREAMGLPPLRE